jgi:hypothetical protein
VDHLSGKPVELGPAKPKRLGSWQVGGWGCLTTGWCLSSGVRLQSLHTALEPNRAWWAGEVRGARVR